MADVQFSQGRSSIAGNPAAINLDELYGTEALGISSDGCGQSDFVKTERTSEPIKKCKRCLDFAFPETDRISNSKTATGQISAGSTR